MSDPTTDFDALPERVILKLDRGYIFLILLVSLVFVAIGIFMIHSPRPTREVRDVFWGWASIVLFGFCTVVTAVEMIVPQLSHIELSREGFRIKNGLRRQPPPTPWNEIATIEVYRWYARYWPRDGVRICYAQSGRRDTNLQMPRMYGYGARELAALMNRFRTRARRQGAASI